MSYDNDQNESALPADGTNKRSSESFLPRFFRTTPNKKFLNSTLDQLIQPGVVEKLNGYVGRETARAFTASDNYIGMYQIIDLTINLSRQQLSKTI